MSTLFLSLVSLLLILPNLANATTYYVRDDGNDSADGRSHATAWRSTVRVNSQTFATGDDVYFRSGDVFPNQRLVVDWNGTITNRAVIGSYYLNSSGAAVIGLGGLARPLFDDNMRGRPSHTPVISITGDYVDVNDLHVLDSGGVGIAAEAVIGIRIRNNRTHRTDRDGIKTRYSNDILIENNEVSFANLCRPDWGCNPTGTSIGVSRSHDIEIRGNFVHEVWGEAINVFYGSTDILIEDNVVYAARSVGIYLDTAQNATIRRNKVIGTSQPTFFREVPPYVGYGIAVNSERLQFASSDNSDGDGVGDLPDSAISRNVRIYDNLVAYTYAGVALMNQYDEITILTDFHVYNNTLIDNADQILHANARNNGVFIRNNILLSISSGTRDVGGSGGRDINTNMSGITFSNNYFSRGNPGGVLSHSTNVYSGIQLARMTGWRNFSSVSQIPSDESFRPTSSSTTRGRGTALMAAPYNYDFFGAPHRNPMDMGAISANTTTAPVPSPTIAPPPPTPVPTSPTPAPGTLFTEHQLQSNNSGLCMSGSAVLGGGFTQQTCSSSSSVFQVVQISSSVVQFRVRGTNLCLENATTALNARALLANCDSARLQQRYTRSAGSVSGTYRFSNNYSNQCFENPSTSAGARLEQWTCGTYANQYFRLLNVTVPTPTPPPPTPVPVTFTENHLQSVNSSLCMSGSAVLGGGVAQQTCSYSSSVYQVVQISSSVFQFRLRGSNLCLENATTALNAPTLLANCDSARLQQRYTRIAGTTSGTYQFRNNSSNQCLENPGTLAGVRLEQWTCGSYANQYFRLMAPIAPPITTPYTEHRLQSNNSGLCMIGSAALGAGASQQTCSSSSNDYQVLQISSSVVQFRLRGTNLCLENATIALNAPTLLANCDSARLQQRYTRTAGSVSGTYQFRNNSSNQCLENPGTAAGARLEQWTCGSYANQFFRLIAPL